MPTNQKRARKRCGAGNLELEKQEGTVRYVLAAELGSTRNDKEIKWNTLPPLEPSTSPVTASGVVDAHGAVVECVGAGGNVEFAYEGSEEFLLLSWDGSVEVDFGDGGPQCGVDVVGGGL